MRIEFARSIELHALGLDGRRQHPGPLQDALDEVHDPARLLAVLRDDHDGADFARPEVGTPVAEHGEVDGDDGEDEGLATATPDHKPEFLDRIGGRVLTASALAVDGRLLLGHL